MANENTNNIVEEIKENVNPTPADPAPANDNAEPANSKVEETKATVAVPKWLIKTARVIEAVAAAFGAVVGGLLIRDTVVKRKRKKHYVEAPSRPREIAYRSYENPAPMSSVSEDIKVDTF